MTDKIVVFSTAGSQEEANRIARQLVERRLAACVTVVAGASSIYRWQGAIEEAGEWLLVIKSSRGLFDRLQAGIRKLHSYQTPEVIAVPIVDGAEEYLQWMDRELAGEE